jgi:Tol biopolymer transport system component
MSNAKKVSGILGILLLTVSLGVILVPGAQQSAESLYEAAVFKKDAGGDMEGAIKIFREVIDRFPNNLEIAAKAQLQIGLCYEKLGRAEAVKAYELVLEKYAGQKEQVSAARARLAELAAGTPMGPSVVELDFPAGEPYELSPDGTMMAGIEFDKGQNIVVCDLKSQEIKFITDYDWSDGSFWAYNPIWSPDGKEIAFNANRHDGPDGKKLMKSTLNGPPRVLLSNEKYWYFPNAWMPDGSAILTIRGEYEDNTQEMGFVPNEGGAFRKILSLNGNVVTSGSSRPEACISPDGRFIVFTNFTGEGNTDIFVATVDGRSSWPLSPHPAPDRSPRWSPDGKHIVFRSQRRGGGELWGVAVENGKATRDPFLIQKGMEGDIVLNWNKKGLVVWKWTNMRDIFLLNVDPKTGEPQGIPRPLNFRPTGRNSDPIWSPDGKSIAFYSRGGSDAWNIVVCQVDGEDARKFVVSREFSMGYLRWTADSKGIGFICYDFAWQNKIRRLDVETGQWTTIPIPIKGDWSGFEWSGNDKTYLYSKNGTADKGAGIYERNIETGEEKLIYSHEGERSNFRWLKCSHDYKWLAFVENNSHLMVVNLATGASRHLASRIGRPAWSPDGKNLLTMQVRDDKTGIKRLTVVPVSGDPIQTYQLGQGLPQKCRIRTHDWSSDGKQVVFEVAQGESHLLLNKNVIPEGKK